MIKRLGLIFGPVIVAVVAVIAGIMLMPEDNNKHDYQAPNP